MDSRLNRHRVTAKEPAPATPSKEKMVDIPYESRTFGDVTVKGFRERLAEAYKTYDANNKKVFAETQSALKKYQETLATLDTSAEYDIKSLVAEVGKARESNQAIYDAIGQITMALGTMAQNYPDVDQTANSIIAEMMDELVGVGALNASNEALKTLTQYLEEYDEITVNFYRVTGGGKEKGERTREYYTYKKTRQTKTIKAGTGYKEALLRLNTKLQSILTDSQEAGADLVKFAKEVNDVLALWSLYLSKTKKKVWGGKEVSDSDIERLLMGYDFYKEIGTDLSFRGTQEAPGLMETKLHAMLRRVKAKIESIVNAPAYAAGVMQGRDSACVEFVEAATDGLKAITAEIYGAELAAKEGKGVVDKVRDFAKDLIPEGVPEPMMQGAAARQRILAKRVTAAKEPWSMSRREFKEAVGRGKINRSTGKRLPGEESAKTPLAMGLINGYSHDDIAHFYAKRRGHGSVAPTKDYNPLDEGRKELVMDALSEGKPVPAEVLADYPELKATAMKAKAEKSEYKVVLFYDGRNRSDIGTVTLSGKPSDEEASNAILPLMKKNGYASADEYELDNPGNGSRIAIISPMGKEVGEIVQSKKKSARLNPKASWSFDDYGIMHSDSDAPVFELGSSDLVDAMLADRYIRSVIVDEAIAGNFGLIDWAETEKNADDLFEHGVDDGFFFKPGEGVYYKENAEDQGKLVIPGATAKDVLVNGKKSGELYDLDQNEIVLNKEAVAGYIAEMGWETFVQESTGDRYAVKLY